MTHLARLTELDAISRTRMLSSGESDQLARTLYREDQRQRRLPARIMRLRARLRRLEAELWRHYLPELEALEAAYAATRLAELEHELAPQGENRP